MCWILELSSVIRANHIHLSVHTVPCIRTHLRTSWTHVSTKAKTPTLEISHRRTLARNSSVAETTVQTRYAGINDRPSMMSMMDNCRFSFLLRISERNLRHRAAILAKPEKFTPPCLFVSECYFLSGQKS